MGGMGKSVGGGRLWLTDLFSVGVIVDRTQNYSSAFYSCAAGTVMGAVFLSLVRPCKVGMCHQQAPGTEGSVVEGTQDSPEDFIDMDIGKADHSGKGSDSVA